MALEDQKTVKIIYPDSDDVRIVSVVTDLLAEGETPVVCGSIKGKEKYFELIEKGLEYKVVEEGRTNEGFASELLKNGKVDGLIGGNISDTKDMVSALIRVIGTREDVDRVSSYFIMDTGKNKFILADGGLAPNPREQDLVEMMKLCLENFYIHGMQKPRVVFLDGGYKNDKMFSAGRSAQEYVSQSGEDVEIKIGGRFDEVYKLGYNIFLFPDLNAGNIAYKIAERMSGYTGEEREQGNDIETKVFSKGDEKIMFSHSLLSDTPDADELMDTAYKSVIEAQRKGIAPRVVFLSYSTKGSGYYEDKGPDPIISPSINAAKKFKIYLSEKGITDVEIVEKECQFDAAFIPEISKKKGLGLEESASVYVFPDKFSGSICMDIPESVNGAMALGPLIQGLAGEAHDVSRGIDEETLKKMYEIVKHMILSKSNR